MRPGPEGTNPQDFDYVVDEYFVSGTAGPTGAGYKARMLVRRPANPEKFSGVVLYGVVPPRAQPIGFDDTTANHGSRLALDGQGNVHGGASSPYVCGVPVEQDGVPNAGAMPAANFKNKGSSISRLNQRLMELVREGGVLPEYKEDIRADAHAVEFPAKE